MTFSKSTLQKSLLTFFLCAFFFIGFLGLGHTEMPMETGGEMQSNCPFMPSMHSLCQMNPFEHIAVWQGMFTALPEQLHVFEFLLLLIASLIIVNVLRVVPVRNLFFSIPSLLQFLYFRHYIPLVRPLQEAFSNGRIQPKVF